MKPQTIPCPSCEGQGQVVMPDELQAMMKQFRGYERDARWFYERMADQIEMTAWNNRLERLRKLGFLSCRKDGKTNKYSLKSK